MGDSERSKYSIEDIEYALEVVRSGRLEQLLKNYEERYEKKDEINDKIKNKSKKSRPVPTANAKNYNRKVSFERIKTLVTGFLIGAVVSTSAFALWAAPKIEYYDNISRGKEILTEAVMDKMVSLGLGGIDENGNLTLFNNDCSAYKELDVDSPLELYLVYNVIEDATTSTKEDKTYEERKFMESVKDAEGKYTYSNLGDYLKYQGYFAENLDGTTNTNRGSVSVFENYMEAEINDLYTNGNIGIYCQQELLGGTLNNYEEGLSNQGGIKK